MVTYDRYMETDAISWWDPPIELQIQTLYVTDACSRCCKYARSMLQTHIFYAANAQLLCCKYGNSMLQIDKIVCCKWSFSVATTNEPGAPPCMPTGTVSLQVSLWRSGCLETNEECRIAFQKCLAAPSTASRNIRWGRVAKL